jgi:hypothetical protein
MNKQFNASPVEILIGKQSKPSNKKEIIDVEFTTDELIEKMHDPSFLPSHQVLFQYFKKFTLGSFEENPEQKKWYDFVFKENKIFEIWTKEYINALGEYLTQRVKELSGTKENPTVILEVGAGDGRLIHFLQEKMNELIPDRVILVASDSGNWKISPSFTVENIINKEALVKYNPRIVICSWMPDDIDFTADFRATASVDEYILIGRPDDNQSGKPWETWGAEWAKNFEGHEGMPPYQEDGFEKEYHNDLKSLQLSRIEIWEGSTGNDKYPTRSSTVSFKKIQKD